MKQTNIQKLKEHLFESIEMLKNQNDPDADPCEKMDIKTAKAVADMAKTLIEVSKLELQAMSMLKNAENPVAAGKFLVEVGFTENTTGIALSE